VKLILNPEVICPDIVNREKDHRRGSGVSILTIHLVNKTQRITS
jgi:hypothetical protein|tara:strand:- start:37 stop:168 length:132 start_codon:yes stop_codon:yes gene_type:complete